jgi:hypothetical protein
MAQNFGSFAGFKAQFSAAANGVEASGWSILGWQPQGKQLVILAAENHQNQTQWGVAPILVLDVGTRVLPQVPEPPLGIRAQLVERGELVESGRVLHPRANRVDCVAAAGSEGLAERQIYQPLLCSLNPASMGAQSASDSAIGRRRQ